MTSLETDVDVPEQADISRSSFTANSLTNTLALILTTQERKMNDKTLHLDNLRLYDIDEDAINITLQGPTVISNTVIRGARNGIVVNSPAPSKSLAQELGLPEDTPVEALLEFVKQIKLSNENKLEVTPKDVASSKLGEFFAEKGLDITTVLANAATITTHPVVQGLISYFGV